MSKVNVTVVDATGNKKEEASLTTDAPVRRIVAALIPKMNMPTTDTDGQTINYKFVHKQSGKQIRDEQTQAEVGVKDGDVLKLSYEMTAG